MGRLAGFRYREIIKRLKKLGFEFVRQAAGSHEVWCNPTTNRYTTPGAPHDVLINPAASATVYRPSEASVRSLLVSGTGSNLVTLNLAGGSIATQNGTTLGANGTLAGSGRLVGNLAVQNGGRVSVGSYETQQLAGNVNVANGGRIDAQAHSGQAGLEIGGTLGNAAGGRVNLLNADVFAHGGTSNSGIISIAGYTTVSGAVDNRSGGQVNVSGVGSQAIFWDKFHNEGSLTVTNSATATFFGLVNGAGNFYGGGAKQFAGGYSPGNSPALTTLSGPISLVGYPAKYGSAHIIQRNQFGVDVVV